MRNFVRAQNESENQTFDEWTNSFETLLEVRINVIETEFEKNHKKHLMLLNRIIDLRNEYEELIDGFYGESYGRFFIDVNKKYLKYAPFYIRKGGSVPLHPELANSLLIGMKISKKETGKYQKFKKYYENGIRNCFNLKERASYFNDNITPCPDSYYKLNNLFPYNFPIENNVLPIGEWIERLRKGFSVGTERDNLHLKEILMKRQLNRKKSEYIDKICENAFFSRLARRSISKKEELS